MVLPLSTKTLVEIFLPCFGGGRVKSVDGANCSFLRSISKDIDPSFVTCGVTFNSSVEVTSLKSVSVCPSFPVVVEIEKYLWSSVEIVASFLFSVITFGLAIILPFDSFSAYVDQTEDP